MIYLCFSVIFSNFNFETSFEKYGVLLPDFKTIFETNKSIHSKLPKNSIIAQKD